MGLNVNLLFTFHITISILSILSSFSCEFWSIKDLFNSIRLLRIHFTKVDQLTRSNIDIKGYFQIQLKYNYFFFWIGLISFKKYDFRTEIILFANTT